MSLAGLAMAFECGNVGFKMEKIALTIFDFITINHCNRCWRAADARFLTFLTLFILCLRFGLLVLEYAMLWQGI